MKQFIVSSLHGSGDGLTFEEAVRLANEYTGPDEVSITFAPELSGATIMYSGGGLDISRDITITDNTAQGVTLMAWLSVSNAELTLNNAKFSNSHQMYTYISLTNGGKLVSSGSYINAPIEVSQDSRISGDFILGEEGGISLQSMSGWWDSIDPLWTDVLAGVDAESIKDARIMVGNIGYSPNSASGGKFRLTAPTGKFSTCKYCIAGQPSANTSQFVLPENGTLYIGENVPFYIPNTKGLICNDGSYVRRESTSQYDEAYIITGFSTDAYFDDEGDYTWTFTPVSIQVNGDVHFEVPINVCGQDTLRGEGTYIFDTKDALTLSMPNSDIVSTKDGLEEYNAAWADPTAYLKGLMPAKYKTCSGAYISYAAGYDKWQAPASFMFPVITKALLKELTPAGFDHCCFVDVTTRNQLTLEAGTEMYVSSFIWVDKDATFTCKTGSAIHGTQDHNISGGIMPSGYPHGDDAYEDDPLYLYVQIPTCYVAGKLTVAGTELGTTLALMDDGKVTGSCTLTSDYALKRVITYWDGSASRLWSGISGLSYSAKKSAYCGLSIDGFNVSSLTINKARLKDWAPKGISDIRIDDLCVSCQETVTVAAGTDLRLNDLTVNDGGSFIAQTGSRLRGWKPDQGGVADECFIQNLGGTVVLTGVNMPDADVRNHCGDLKMTGCSGIRSLWIGDGPSGQGGTVEIHGCDLSNLEWFKLYLDTYEGGPMAEWEINLSGNYWGTMDETAILSKFEMGSTKVNINLGTLLEKNPCAGSGFDMEPPTGLTSETKGKTAILAWDAALGAASYIIKLTNTKTGKVTLTKTVRATSVVLSVADGEYTWTVQAISAAGIKSDESPANNVVVDLTAPKAVTKLTATQMVDGLVLTWTAPKDATSLRYTVEYSENADFSGAETMEVEGSTASIPAAANARLYFRVKATDKGGNESPWASASVMAVTTKGKSVTLGWAAVSDAATYTVTFTGADGKTVVKKVKTNTLTASLADNEYGWTVQALDKKGQVLSTQTGKGFKVDSIAPTKVDGLFAGQKEGASGEAAVLTWEPSTDASDVKYIVEYSVKSNFAKGTVTTMETVETSAELPVTPGQYVYYRVTAVDSFGNKSKTVTGKYGEPSIAPTNQQIASVNGRKVTVSWDAAQGATSYVVKLTNTKTGKVTMTKTVKTTSAVLSVADGDYTWTVQAVSAAGIKSDETPAGELLLDLTAPKAVTKLTATQTDEGLALTWTAPADATSLRYTVEYSENADFSGAETMEVDGTTAAIPAAANAQLYFRVKATDKAGNESAWAGVSVMAVTTKGKSVTLGWAAVSGAATYTVTFTGAGGKTVVKKVKTNTLTASLADNEYGWTVQALDKKGNVLSTQTGKGFKVDSIAPTKVKGLEFTISGSPAGMTMELRWAKSTDASSVKYLVEYSENKAFKNGTVTAMEVTDPAVTLMVAQDTTLYYRIRAVDSFGNKSAWVTGSQKYQKMWATTPVYWGGDDLPAGRLASSQELALQDEDTAGIESWVGGSKGSDLYALTLDKDASLHIGLDATPQPVNVQVTAQGATAPVATACGSGLDKELALSAGTYYVEVSAVGAGSAYNTGYTLDLELETEGTRRQAMLASPLS